MLTYNTQLKHLILPEYGRNIQNMVDHCLTIEDRADRTACAYSIIQAMSTLFPNQGGNQEAYRHKLWDHLAIMSNFGLDIDWPVEVPQSEALTSHPDALSCKSEGPGHRQYGKMVEHLAATVERMEPGEERDELVVLLANHMKKLMLAVNSDGVDDEKVFKDLYHLTHGVIHIFPDELHLHEFKAAPTPGKKKKKK